MPAIAERIDCLKGCVFAYKGRPGIWYYREYNASTQKYKYIKVKDATSIEDAATKAIEAFTELREPSRAAKPQRAGAKSLEKLMRKYLENEERRRDAGIITEETCMRKGYCIARLGEYLAQKGIKTTQQLKQNTFDDYAIYRGKSSKLTRNYELKEYQTFLNWLVRNEHMKTPVKTKKERVNEEDLTANPAINSEDWAKITAALREHRKKGNTHSNPKTKYWRALFHHFCLVLKQTGLRPGELRNLRWKDVEFLALTPEEEEARRAGGMNSETADKAATCYIHVRKSKTRTPREVPAKCGREIRRWKDYLMTFCEGYHRKPPTAEDLIFGNCDNEYKAYIQCFFSEAWQEAVRGPLTGKLKGHPYSDKPYTLYSLRSTMIEDNLLQPGGCDVFYLARVCGHDVKILQRHYERITVRTRAGELKQIPFGARNNGQLEVGTLI